MKEKWRFYRKLHRWPGLIIAFILIYFAITGILMNHRSMIAGIDLKRNLLPDVYKYDNWNNAALKGNLIINNDSILVFGNIGIWLTDSAFSDFKSLNAGFPVGSDNRKIFDVHRTANGELYAATLFGLYSFNNNQLCWQKINLESESDRFTGIESINDTLYIINRSELFTGFSAGVNTKLISGRLEAPPGYDDKVTLFETIWQIHSGEIFGLPGQLFTDLLGIITFFLAVTGIIYFFFPGLIRRRSEKKIPSGLPGKINRLSLKWHNKIGALIFGFLILLYMTGMFLRPPLLIAIANARISPLKFSHLDQPNPWYDKLRDIIFDAGNNIFLLSTSDGIFYMPKDSFSPVPFVNQPPVSVMGINTFEKYDETSYLIGSFSGLFLWNPMSTGVINFATGSPYIDNSGGRPIGDFKVSGTISDSEGRRYMVDYDKGIVPLWHGGSMRGMPDNILNESGMSLWNVCLEIHTGRIFQGITGPFYILIVPLAGITAITVVLSGYLLYRRKNRSGNKGK